jgi:hypothetical protein
VASIFQPGMFTPAAGASVAAAVEVSLHSAQPETSGSNELSGGGYERQPVTWGTPASGIVTASADPVFDVPDGGTWVRWCGLWADGGEWLGAIELTTQVEYPAAGTYTISPLRVGARNPTT